MSPRAELRVPGVWGPENTGNHRDGSSLFQKLGQPMRSTLFEVIYLPNGWPTPVSFVMFEVGQMTHWCVECLRAHSIGAELTGEGCLHSEVVLRTPSIVLGELSMDSERVDWNVMCRYALLRIQKTDKTGLIIPHPTHLSGADFRTKKCIEVIETLMHRGSTQGRSLLIGGDLEISFLYWFVDRESRKLQGGGGMYIKGMAQ